MWHNKGGKMYFEHKKKQLKLSLGTRDRQERFAVKTAAKRHLCCTFKDENGCQEGMERKMQHEAEWWGERELTLQEEAVWESTDPGKGFVG